MRVRVRVSAALPLPGGHGGGGGGGGRGGSVFAEGLVGRRRVAGRGILWC